MKRIDVVCSHLENREIKFNSHINLNQTAGIRMGSLDDIQRRVNSWNLFLNETAPKRMQAVRSNVPKEITVTFDVIVVGFGAAGACAALESADRGKRVLLIDRFDGGGSTRRSGGVYYAGGGTDAQKDMGINDDVTNMFNYILKENQGAVDPETVKEFCSQSPENFRWLEQRIGVPFKNKEGKREFYEKKASYPPSFATLYFSGNESAYPFHTIAEPAPRGNRVFGDYLTGNVLFNSLEKCVESHPLITIQLHTRGQKLIMDSKNSKCVGIDVDRLDEDFQSTHVMLHEIGSGATYIDQSGKIEASCRTLEAQLFSKFSSKQRLLAKNGVIIATGGFFFNREMVEFYAPKYSGYMPLGNLGDDGSGIILCKSIGCDLGRMDRCSAWKFTNPPFSFLYGVVVNTSGERVGNEDLYGASFADCLIQKHNGKGWLIIDQETWDQANEDCMNPTSGLQEDQKMQGLANLHKNRVEANNAEELSSKIGAPKLIETLMIYNSGCESKNDSQFGKLSKYLKSLAGNLYAIKLDMVGNKYWPTPCMSLGGVEVDGKTGLAKRNNLPVSGLYVAGRCAVGICSNYYISGLSLADAVFSGRRAGRHAANLD